MMSEKGNVMRGIMSRRAALSKECGGWRSKSIRGGRREARGEKGFTLIELLIVTSVMPIIVGAISGGLFTVLSLQTSTMNRLADTSDGQVISSTFIKDVQSATFITTLATSSPQCGSGTQLLGLQWGNSAQDITNSISTNPSTLVSYNLVPVIGATATTYSLVREYCTAGNFATPAGSTTVSYDVIGTGPNKQPPPCYSGANCNPSVFNTPIGWTSPAATVTPTSTVLKMPVVKFVIAEANSKIVFTLMANSLSWTPAAGGGTVGPAFSPLTLLSPSGTVLNMSGASILSITGTGPAGTTVALASSSDGSVPIPADADLTASSVFTEDTNLASLLGPGLGTTTPEYYASSIPDP